MTDKREHILTVAEELFGYKGFDGTSVRDIAQTAGVNLAMISYYFGSKEKLLESLIEFRSNYAYGILEELNKDESLSPWDKVDRLVEFYVDRILNNLPFHNIMHQQGNNSRSEEIRNMILKIKMRNIEQVKKIITDGQAKKLFRNVDIELTIGSLIGTITTFTQSREFGCVMLKIDWTDQDAYRAVVGERLRPHLKKLLRAHLDIKNDDK
jgi:AcrR family transcriptional regulator